ncbi:MAG: transposase [Deltaproteobacteria bacterium]|nr:transposase [Deltaproteobacteria bacterium]
MAKCYHADNGRPTKDLSTMIGLVVLQQLTGLNNLETVNGLRYDRRFQHALNIPESLDEYLFVSIRTYNDFNQAA